MKESEKLELKRSTAELKEAVRSIVAILNKHQKGEIYFGINNDGNVNGQDVTENTIREISQAIASMIDPIIYPTIEKVMIKGKVCIKVSFFGMDTPYLCSGQAYIRVGGRKYGYWEIMKKQTNVREGI